MLLSRTFCWAFCPSYVPAALQFVPFHRLIHLQISFGVLAITRSFARDWRLVLCCGFLSASADRSLYVPLDYQNPEHGRAYIPLIKSPFSSNSSLGPYKGMILFSPGGPGSSGVSETRDCVYLLQVGTGNMQSQLHRRDYICRNWSLF